ncbi:carbamoyl phosphate synthase large subunit, partial [Marinobacter koreensis]|nr:carbamoyl phosphate synthase large subunit [Marinobacter koreensis]
PTYYAVKESVFPFNKFPAVDPILGPEMKSTGEVMGLGDSFDEAFAKAELGAGESLPCSGRVFLSVRDEDKPGAVAVARRFLDGGFELVATAGTAEFLVGQGVSCDQINKIEEGRPHVLDAIRNREVDLVLNTSDGRATIAASAELRRMAVRMKIPMATTLAGGEAYARAIAFGSIDQVRSLQQIARAPSLQTTSGLATEA